MDSAHWFSIRRWPDGVVVFNRMTGDTHALDPITYAAFEATQRGDNDRTAVIAACHSLSPLSSADELESMAHACYERLEQCGLTAPTGLP